MQGINFIAIVLEPESVRNEMRNFAKNMLDYYTWKEEDKPCGK